MGNKVRTLFHKISKNYPLLHEGQFLTFLPSKWSKNGPFLDFLEILYFFVISTQGIMGNKVRTLFHKISKNYPLLHWSQFLPFLQSKWWKNGLFLHFLEIVYFFVISTQGIMGNKVRTLFHKISKNYPLLHEGQFFTFLPSKWSKNGPFLDFLEILYFFVISTQGIMGNKLRTLFHKISKNYPLLHEGQFLTFLPSKWSKNGPFLDFLEIVYFFVISTQGIMGNKLRTLFHKISKNYPLLHWSQFLPFLQSKWWKNGLFLHFLEIVYFFVISTLGIMGNKVRTLFHKISKNYTLLHEGQFLTFLPSKWSKNGPFLDFLEILYFFVISTQGIMGNKLRTLFHKISKNYPLLHEGQFLTFLPSKWSKNGPFLDFLEIVYFFVISTQGIMGNKLRTLFHKISKNYPLLNCTQVLTFFTVKMIKKGPFLQILEIVYFFVISTLGIMGNKVRTLFHKISKNYPLLHEGQFLTFLPSKWSKNGPFLDFLEIVYFFVISTQGIMGNKVRTLFHKISKNYPLLHEVQFLTFLPSKWSKNGPFLDFLEILYFFVISTQGIMGNKLRTLFHKISKNYPLLHEGQFLIFLPSKWSKNGPFLDFLEIVYFFVISTQGIMGNKLRTLFHKISKNYPLLHWSQFLPFLQSKWWKNGLFLHFLEILYFFVISTLGIMGNKVRTLFHKISKNYPLLHEGQFLTFLPSKWSKNGPFLDFLEIVYFFVISTQGIMGNKLRTLFHKISKNYPLLHEGQFSTFLPSKWSKNGPFLDFLEIVYFFVISSQGIMGNKLRTLFHKISKNYPLLHWSQFLPFLQSKWWKNGLFLHFLEIVYFFVISTQGIMGNKVRTLFHKISKNCPLLHEGQFLTFLPSKWSKNGPFLDFLEIVYFFVISTQGIMGNKLRTLFHKISKNYPLLHEGQFLTFLPSKWSKNGPFLDFLEILYFFVISTQGIMGNKVRTLFHKISKNYPLLHWSQFLPFLQSKWWKNGLFLHFLEIVYFFVISTQGIMGNKVRTLFHKISKNYPLLHWSQFLTFLPSKWSKNGPFLDFLEILYFFVISTQGIMGNKLRTLFHKISKNYPLLHWSQFLPFLQSKWWKNGLFLHFLEIVYFFVISTQGIMGNKVRTLFHKISKNYPLLHEGQFLTFLPSKWSKNGPFLDFLEILYFFVISTQGIMGNKLKTLFHKISKNYPLLHWSQFLPFLQSKWWKNGLFLHFLEIVYFFVISTQGIMGNKLRTLFHKISKNYPLLNCSQVLTFFTVKMIKKGPFLQILEIVYFFVISTQGIMGNKVRTLFHKISKNYPLLHEGQFLTFLPSKWSKNGPFLDFLEIVYFFVISTQGIMGNKLRTLFHKISKNYPLLHWSQFLPFLQSKWWKNGLFLHFLEIVYFFVISTQGIMGNKVRTLFHKISKNCPLLHEGQFLTFLPSKWSKNGPFLDFLEIVYFFVISTQGIMGNKLRTLFHKISKNYPLLHEGQFLTFLPSKWSKNGPFLDFLEILYFFVISTQGIMGNKVRTLFHKISKNYPLLHWSQFLPFLQSKWWKNGLFLHFLEIVYFFVISTQGIMGNKVRTLFHKISKNYPLLHWSQFLTFLPSKWSKNGPFLDFLEILYFFVISTQGIMGNKLRTLFHKISKNYPLLHWSQFLPFLQSKWWKNGLFLHFLEIVYFFVISTQGIMGNKVRTLFHKISKNYPLLHEGQFLTFLPSKWSKNGPFLDFLEILYFFVISTQGIMGNKLKTLFHKISKNYPLLHWSQFLPFLQSKWWKNGLFLHFLEIVYFFVISTQGIMGNKLRTLFHKISKNYPLLNCSQVLTFFTVKMIKKGPFLQILEIVYFFVISTQGIMGNKVRTLFHKISKNYPLLHEGQFLTFLPSKWSKNGPFLDFLEIVYFFVISTQGIMGNKLRTLFHKISKNYPLLHWSQFLPFLQSKWWKNGLFLHFLEIVYFFVISTQGIMGNKVRTLFHKISKNCPLLHEGQFLTFLPSKWLKNGPFLDFLEIVYFFVISTQGIMGNKLRTLFHKISKNYPLLHEGQFLTFLPSKWSKNGPFLDFLEIVYFFVISTQGIMGNKLRTLFHKISKNYPLLHWSQFLPFLQSKWWKNGLFLHFLEIVYFFVISTQGIMGNKVRTLFHKISKNYPLLHEGQFLTFLPSKWSKNGPFLDFLEIVYFFVISTQGIMGNKVRTLFHKISKNYPLLHEGQFLTFLPSKWSKNGPFLDFLEILYFFVISTQGIMGNKLRTLFHKISKNYPLLHWSQFLLFLQSKWWKNGLFLHFLEIVYFFVISTQGIMGNKLRTLFHKISKNYPLLHEGQFLTFLPSKWSKNGPFLDVLEIVYFFVISTQGIIGNKLRTLFHKISKNYPLLHWSQFLPFLQSKWWKNGLFLHFLEIVYFFVISTQGIMGNKVRTLFHKISKNCPLLHEGQFLTFLPSKWSKNGPFLDFLEIVYFFVISTQGIMGNKLRTLFHKISKNYPLLHEGQFLTFLPSKWSKNGPFLDFLEILYFFVISTQGIMGNKVRTLFHKISKNYPLLHWSQFLPFLQSKWWKNGLFLHFLEIVYFFVISTQGIMGNKVRTLFHKISKNYPLLHWSQFLTFLPSKWSKNGPFLDFLEIVYFFVISTQGIMGNKLRTLFHKISKNYPLLHWSQFLPFLQSKWWKNGLFLHFLEIVYFFVISTQGIMGNKVRTLFHKISKNYPLLHEGQFLTFLPSKWSKNGPFLDVLEIVYFFVISTQGIMGNKLRTLFHKISKNYPLLHWSQFLPFLQSKWWKNGLFLHFLEIVYFFVISTQGIMGNKVRTLFHKISKNYPLLHWSQFLPFLQSKWWKNGLFLHFLEIVYFFVISTQGIMGNKVRTLFHKISKNYPLLHEGQFLTFLPSKWSKNGPFLDFLEIVYFFVISTQGIMGNKLRTLFHKISKNYPLLHWSQFLLFLQSKWWKNGLFLHFLEIVYFFVISTQGIMGNKLRTLFHKISKNYPLLHEGQFLTFLPSKWSKNGPFLDVLEIVYFFVISTQGISGNKLRTLFHKISKNYPLLHWSQFLPFLQSKWWKNGLFLHFLEIVYFFVISTQGIMGNKVRTLFHKISKNYPLLHWSQFLTFLPSKWSKNGPFLEIVYFFVISTQGIMGNKLRTLFHKISKNYPLLHEGQFLTFLPSKWSKNGPFLDFLEILYFFVISTQGIMGNKVRTLFHKISKNYPLLHWSQFLPFLQSKWWKNGLFLYFLEIVYFSVISTQGIMGNKVRTLFHKISKNYPLLHEGQFLTFLPSKWSKNGPFLDFLEILYFFVISTQGIMGNKLKTLFHKISKNYPLLHWSQFLPFLQSKWWKNGLFLHFLEIVYFFVISTQGIMGNKLRTLFHKISKNYPLLNCSQVLTFFTVKMIKKGPFLQILEIVYFFVISTQGIMGNKVRTLFHKISKNYPLLHEGQFLTFLPSKWSKNGPFLDFLEIVYFFVISTQGIMGNKLRTLFHKISKNYPLLHWSQFLPFLQSKWWKNGLFLHFLEIVYFFVISTQGIMGNKVRTLFHKISKNCPLLHEGQFLTFLPSKWSKNGPFLDFLEILYFFVISTQGIMGNKLRTLFHKISKNYPLLHEGQFLTFLPSKWSKNGPFLDFLEILYFFVISTQGIMGNKVRTLFHKISKNYPLLHWSQFLPFLQSKWWKNGLFLHFLEIVYFFVISTQGIMGNKVRTLFHKISKNYPLLHWSQFLTFLPSKWSKNGPFLDFLEILYFFVISTQGIMGNKLRTLFHKISKNYPLLHWSQFLPFLQSKWWKNGLFLHFLEIVYFFVISTQGIMGNKVRTLFHKISKNYPLLHWSQFLPFLQSKWWKNGLFLHFLEIVYFFVISTQGIMGNKVRTLFHKISKNYPLLHEGQFLTFLPSKWSKNGPFLDFLEIVYFFVISTQGIMGNKLRTLFHKISKNYPLLHWSQFLLFLQSKWWKNGLFLHFLEIVYFFVISTQGIMGNKLRTLFHKISKNYPLLHEGQFLTFLPSKWSKNGPFLDVLEIVYFFVISTQGISGNKLRTLFHKISKNYPLLHWSQFLPFLQSKWWKNGLFLHFLEIVYFFVISTQGIMGNKVRTLFHKISKNYPLLHWSQFLTFLPSKWSKNGPFLDFLEIVYFFVISTQGIMGNKLRTLFHKISKNYPLLHEGQFLTFLPSKWSKNGPFLDFLEILYFFVISTQGIMGNKVRTLFHKISKNYPLLHWSQFLPFLQSKWWKNGLFLYFLEIVYFSVISTQGIMGNKVRTLFHKISKNYPLLHEGQFLTFLPSKWSKNGPFLDFLEILYFFVISTQGIMGNKLKTLFHKISKNYPLLHWSQFLPFLQSKWWKNGLFLHFLEIVYFFVISTQGIMGNKLRTLFHKISKNYPLLNCSQVLTFFTVKMIKKGPFLQILEIVYFFVISTQGIMGNKVRTLFHKISKNYPLLHEGQFLTFLPSKWSKNGPFLDFLEIVYFFVISTQGIMGNKLRTLFHKISKNYPLLHWSQFLPFLQSKWWKNGLFLHFLEIVYFFVISTQGIMGNKVRTLFHKISKNCPLLHEGQFLTFLPSKWSKNGPFLDFLEIVYFFVISTQGIMGNKLRTLFHKISKNYPLLHEGQFLTFLPSKWSKNGPFLDFLEILYFFVISTQGIMGNKVRTLFHKISKNYPLLHWSQFLPFLQSKWWKNGLFLHFLEIVYFFVISTQGIMGNKVRTLFHKISKNYPLLHWSQFLTFLPSKWSKNGPFLDFLEILYFFVISTQGIMGNKLRTLFHKISKNYPLLHWSQFLPFLQSKWWKNGLFLHFLEIVYFFVISTQGIMGNKVRTLFHKISKNYPLLHEGQFLTFLPSKWSKNGPFLDFLEILYFFVISTQGIMGNKLKTLFHKISKNYPLLHWSQFLPFLQSKWWKNGLFLHFLEIVYFFVISTQGIMGNKLRTLFHKISKNYPLLNCSQVLTFFTVKMIKKGPFLQILEIVYFFVISTQGIMGNKVRTLFHKISKNYPLLHEGQFLTFLPSKWSKNGPFLDFLEIVYFFVISTQGIMGNKLRTLFHKISKNYPLLHWSQFLPFLQSKWWKNGLFLHFLEIVYFFVISTQGIMGNKVRTLFHKISKNCPLLHEGQFLTFLPSKWSKNGPFLDFLEIVYFFVISTQGIMGNKLRTLFHKISKNYPLLHEGQFLTFLPSKWSKNGPFLDFLEIVYFFVISTQGIMGNKLRTLFHKISKNYPLLHWSQFLPFLQSKWWKNGLFLHFLEIVYFFVISTQGIMGNKVRTLFHKISKNYPLLHEGQFLTFLPSKWSKNGPFLDFLEIVYFFVISTQGIMGNKVRTLFHKISKNYPLLHEGQFLTFLPSKWSKNGPFLDFLEILYFFVISTQGIMGNKLRTLFHKISKNYPLLHWSQFLLFLQSKWWKNGLFLHFLEIVYFFVISTQGIMGNKLRTLFHKISKNYPLLHEGQFLTFLPSKWSKNGPFLDVLEIVYFFVISTQGIIGNKLRTLFHKISKNYPLLHWSQFLPFLQSKWWKNGLFLHFLEIVYFFVISTQGIMGNKVRTLFHKISKNCPLLHEGQFLTFLPSKWSKNGPFLDFLEIVYFFVISTQGIMGNKLRTLFHKISKNYPLLHEGQFLTFLPSKWSKNGPFLDFLEILYFFVISTQGIMGNKVRTLFHKISKNYPLLHWSQFLPFLQSKWWKNGLFLHFLEIVYFFVISTQGIMGNKVRTLFHKISKNYPLLHWSQFLTFLPSKWSKNGPFLDFLEIVYFFVISTQGIMGNKLRTLFHKISKNYPLLHWSQFLPFLQSKWWKNGLFLHFLEIVYFFVISTQGIMGNKVRTLFHKISKNYPLLHWSQFLPFLQSKWWKNGLFLHFLEIVYFFVISTQGIMGNKVRTLFHKISKNYPLLHEGQFLTFLPSKWSKNGPFLDFLEIVYFFVISTQGIMGNKLRTLFHKISKNYPLLHWSQFLLFLQSKWWKNGLFLHFLEIVYFFVISTQGIMGNKLRTLFHKISKNYPLLHEGQFLTFLPSKWSKNGPFLDVLEIVYFFVISTQGIIGNKLRTLFHKISKNYPLLHWSQFLPFLQSKWWKNGLFLHFLEIVYFFVISTQGIMGNKVRTLFHKISKNYPLLHWSQFLTFLPSKWSKNGPFLDFLEIVYFFVISTQGIMGNKLRTLFHKISKNYPLLHEGQFLTFLPSKWSKNGPFLDFLEILYFFVISTQGIMGNKVRTLFHKISKNYPLLHWSQFLPFFQSKWWKNGLFLHFLEIVYFFVISTQGIMGNKVRTLFHKISKNYPLLHEGQFLTFLPSKWSKNGPFLDFLEILYFFVISTQGIMGNKLKTLFHKISKNYPLLHWSQFLPFLQSKWWKNGLFLHFLEIVYFFVISTQGIMGNKLRTLFHKISKNYPLLNCSQVLTFFTVKMIKKGPFLQILEIVYFFVISTQGIMGNKVRTLFHKISKNYPLLHEGQFLTFLPSKW